MNENAPVNKLSCRPVAFATVLVFSVLSPNVDLFPELTWHDSQRILQCAALVGVLLWELIAPTSKTKTGVWSHWTVTGCVMFFVFGGISSSMSSYPQWAMLEWGWFLALVLLFRRIVSELGEFPLVSVTRWVVGACALAVTAFVVKAGIIYFGMMTIGRALSQPFDLSQLFAGFSNPRFFGQWTTLLLPLLLLLRNFPFDGLLWRTGIFLLPSLMWVLVIASYTRGSWVGLSMGFLAAMILGRRQATGLLVRAGATAFAGGLIYGFLFLALPLLMTGVVWVKHRQDVMTLAGRDIHWTLALDMISQHPWFGVGPMHFAMAQNHGEYLQYIGATHPHNAVLQIASEWGIPAALIVMLLVLRFVRLWWVSFRTRPQENHARLQEETSLALAASLAGAAVQSMVDGVLVMPVSQLTLVLIAAWAAVIVRPLSESPYLPYMRFVTFGQRGLHLLALILIVYGVVPDIIDPNSRIERYHLTHPGVYLWPRFWAQGWIDQ